MRSALILLLAVPASANPRARGAVPGAPASVPASAPLPALAPAAPEPSASLAPAPETALALPALAAPAADPARAAAAESFIDDFLAHTRDVSLRDGHQSLDGNRWTIEERAPVAALLDGLGLHSVEAGGGADFDVATLIGEDPFENQRVFNRMFDGTDQQWLFRGRNALGLGPQPPDVIAATVEHAAANGLRRIRVFDGMNDVRNVRSTIEAARAAGVFVEGALAYTTDPEGAAERVWTADAFLEIALAMKEMGAQAIAVKDMAGRLTEAAVAELVGRLHREVGLPISVHSHSSTGRAEGVLLKALAVAREVGASLVIDAAIGDLSGGTSHPDVRDVLRAELARAGFAPADYLASPKLRLLEEIAALIAKTAARHKPKRIAVDAEMSRLLDESGIPGGMVGTTANILRPHLGYIRSLRGNPDLTLADVLKEGLRRVPKVRKDAGLPPLVTPMSQFVLMQAVFNFIEGADYVRLHPQFSPMMKGRFGRVRGRPDPALLERLMKEDMLRALRDRGLERRLGDLAGLPLSELRARVESLRGRVADDVLEAVLYEGQVGPARPLPPGMPALLEEARRLAFRRHLDIRDPREAALLLTAREGRAVLSRPGRAWNAVVGRRPDGFPIVVSLENARTRAEIEAALGDLPARVRRGEPGAREEAARRLDALGLEGRARVAGRLILDELIEREPLSPGR